MQEFTHLLSADEAVSLTLTEDNGVITLRLTSAHPPTHQNPVRETLAFIFSPETLQTFVNSGADAFQHLTNPLTVSVPDFSAQTVENKETESTPEDSQPSGDVPNFGTTE